MEQQCASERLAICAVEEARKERDQQAYSFGINHAICPSSTFYGTHNSSPKHCSTTSRRHTSSTTQITVRRASDLAAIFNKQKTARHHGAYIYSRSFNPSLQHLGALMAALEGTEAAYPCSSGISAICCTLMHFCQKGDRIVASNALYGGTTKVLNHLLPTRCDITTTFVDIDNVQAVNAALATQPTPRVLYMETMSNPTLHIADIPTLAACAHKAGAVLVVDNTFAPVVCCPASWGADVVVSSLTKFVCGNGDIVGGCVAGPAQLIDALLDVHAGTMMLLGPTMDPRTAAELAMRVQHLPVRMAEHCRRASCFAQRLQDMGVRVWHPSLADHPHHARAQQLFDTQGCGYGGLLCIDCGTLQVCGELMMGQ